MNLTGMLTFTKRDILRFLKVINQTLFPPIVSTLLFLAVFHFVLGRGGGVSSYSYLEFLVPGLAMMSVIRNSFANSSSSLFISKFTNHFQHILTMPLSYFEIATAYVLGAMARGLLTAAGIFIAVGFFVQLHLHSIAIMILFFLLASFMFGSLGILAALWAEEFDHLGIFNTFVLTPLTMLGGVFYSISMLPEQYQILTKFNPIFFLVDGFRYGMLGIKDHSIIFGAILSLALAILSFVLVVWLMKKGWKVKE